MLPREQWAAYASGSSLEPLDLAAEIRQWSGVRTAG